MGSKEKNFLMAGKEISTKPEQPATSNDYNSGKMCQNELYSYQYFFVFTIKATIVFVFY